MDIDINRLRDSFDEVRDAYIQIVREYVMTHEVSVDEAIRQIKIESFADLQKYIEEKRAPIQ